MRALIVLIQFTLVTQAQSNSVSGNQQRGHTQGSMDHVVPSEVSDKLVDQAPKIELRDHSDLENTTLGFMVGLPQSTKLPKFKSRVPQGRPDFLQGREKSRVETFRTDERIRLLAGLLDLASFQDQERARLQSFQEQERVRLQVEQQALRSFQGQEKERLSNLVRSLGKAGQSLESFQEQERLRLQAEVQAIASFQDRERLRLQSLGRALDAIDASAIAKRSAPVSDIESTQTAAREAGAGPRSELSGQVSPDVSSIGALAMASIFLGGGVSFAVLLRTRRSVSTTREEPLLV